jgi:hypothetical protein
MAAVIIANVVSAPLRKLVVVNFIKILPTGGVDAKSTADPR